jgi:dsRNA-specific ribonuclease
LYILIFSQTFRFSSDLWNNDDQAETCELYVGDKLFATARAQSKKLAKEAAAKVALEILAKELEA